MAIHRRDNPVGVDLEIDRIQKHLYDRSSWADYESYDRAYVNPNREGKKIPEIHVSGNEYREVYFNDNFAAESYFLVESSRNKKPQKKTRAKVSLIVQIDLEQTYPNILHRADEEAHNEIFNLLEKYGVEEITLITEVENVYKGFDLDKTRLNDMQPCHVFRVEFDVNYEYHYCINNN